MTAQILRKLTLRTAGWTMKTIKDALGEDGSTVDLLKIAGVTTQAVPGVTDKGEFISLRGQFRAVNMMTGEMFDAGSCILPTFISDSIAHALNTSPEVEFALMIGAQAVEDSVTGYQFTVRPLVETKVSEKLAGLLASAGMDRAPELPAPAPAAAPAKGRK